MINPADARAYYFYTPADVATAREILSTGHRYKGYTIAIDPATGHAYLDKPLYPADWVKWAQKVLTWYGRFIQVLRRYARALSSVALAQIAVWQNLRAGISVPRMLRTETAAVQVETASTRATMQGKPGPGAKWRNNPPQSRDERARNGSPITPHTEKRSHKTERRAEIVRTVNHYQTHGQPVWQAATL